jgi:acetate kinase
VSVYSYQSSNSDPHELAVVQVDGLTAPPPKLKYERSDHKVKGKEVKDVKDQEDAFRFILEQLEKDEGLPELKNRDDIGFACHRIVHGGDYNGPKVVDGEAFRHIEELSNLAPL